MYFCVCGQLIIRVIHSMGYAILQYNSFIFSVDHYINNTILLLQYKCDIKKIMLKKYDKKVCITLDDVAYKC